MRVFEVPVPTVRTNLFDLVGDPIPHLSSIVLQAPEANVSIIYFGDMKSQPFELRPKANAQLHTSSAKSVFVKGTPPDRISIGFL